MRWTRRIGASPSTPLVQGDRIAIASERVLSLFDARGDVMQRIALADEARVELLAPDGPVLVDGTRVQQRAWDGALAWQVDVEQDIVAVQRSPLGELAVCTHERGYPPRGRLVVIDRGGVVRWSFDEHGTAGHVFRTPELAFDDVGNLYTLVTGRLGDGVSGDDVATGGCRGFDRGGRPLWTRPLACAHPQSIRGRERGVVVVGMRRVHAYDDAGVQDWECELDDGDVHALPSLGLRLTRSCARLRLPRVLAGPEGGGGTILSGVLDADDVFFFARVLWSPPRTDLVLALAADGELRWQLPVKPIDYDLPSPVIGPDDTLLFTHGEQLVAVG